MLTDEFDDGFFYRDTEEGEQMNEKIVRKLHRVIGVLFGVIIVVVVAAAGAFAYSVYKSWEIDYRNHQAMVQIIQYNLQQGTLKMLPQPVAPPPAAPGVPVVPPQSDQPHPAKK